MRHFSRTVVIVLLTYFLGPTFATHSSCQNAQRKNDISSNAQQPPELRVIIPKARGVQFLTNQIDQRAAEENLPVLRTTLLPKDDLEVRFWSVVSHYGIDGLVLRRSANEWSSIYLYGYSQDPNFKKYQKQGRPPLSGWARAWAHLVDTGILDLPDASEVQCNVFGYDGITYVVETNENRPYRTYIYDNPMFAKCDEAKQMLKLIEILNSEFGLQWPTKE